MDSIKRHIFVFGGLGSSRLFSKTTSHTIKQSTLASSTAFSILEKSFSAFSEMLGGIDPHDLKTLELDARDFQSKDSLIYPAARYHEHGIIELTTMTLFQLLYFIGYVEQSGKKFSSVSKDIAECVGLCAGLLPATVISCSSTIDQYVSNCIEAFRLSFWIGYRSVNKAGVKSTIKSPNSSWSLFVNHLEPYEAQKLLDESQVLSVGDRERNDATGVYRSSVRISVVSANFVSFSGAPTDLLAVERALGQQKQCLFTQVHTWYHGGCQLADVVSQIENDVLNKGIRLPSISALTKPLRSTLDGTVISRELQDPNFSLIRWVLEHILVHSVHWNKVIPAVLQTHCQYHQSNFETRIELRSFGPSTESLVSEIEKSEYRDCISIEDKSPFSFKASEYEANEQRDGIAIVGMGLNLPNAKDADALWQCLSQGLSAVQKVPNSRFDITDYHQGASPLTPNRSLATNEGAFLDDVWIFDNEFFRISPREALSMDPQQRILLHTAQAAFEDAGYVPDSTPSFERKSIGCYIGVATGDYEKALQEEMDVYYSTGTLRAFHSGRISHFFGFGGPCATVDTACSSSAVSIHQACQALMNGDCTSAIAGGVNVICGPDMFIGLDKASFLAESGGCKPFDKSANGYCRGEGCVLFVLKRLSSAIAENDRIHAVIRGVAVNQCGNQGSITQPDSQAQAELFRAVLSRSKIDPSSVDVVEAHGTGTQLGDQSEIASLLDVFGPYHSIHKPLCVSSIKGNIGHCEAASGGAGLAKILLMLRHKQIPKQSGYANRNPLLTGLQSGFIRVPDSIEVWHSNNNSPRRALLNNFGAAGSNCSIIVEEAVHGRIDNRPMADTWSAYPFVLSAQSRSSLQRLIKQLSLTLDRNEKRSLQDVCYTATARRQLYEYRVAFAATSLDLLKSDILRVKVEDLLPLKEIHNTVFVFSGQGATYPGMAKELFRSSEYFRAIILDCDRITLQLGCPTMVDYFINEKSIQRSHEETTIVSQCASVALQYGLASLLMSWGIMPKYLIGHSIGEYSALAISGALKIEDVIRITALRAKMVVELCEAHSSAMTAIEMSTAATAQLLSSHKPDSETVVSCYNGPSGCVVSGPVAQIEDFEKLFSLKKVRFKRLDVPYGFHSSAMDAVVPGLRHLSGPLRWNQPQIPVISTVFGDFLELEQHHTKDYFAVHTRNPVLFTGAIEVLERHGGLNKAICLEIGPHPITLPLIAPALSSTKCEVFTVLDKNKPAWLSLSTTLARLALSTQSIMWRKVFSSSRARFIDLPGYQLQGKFFRVPFRERKELLTSISNKDDGFTKTNNPFLPMVKSISTGVILRTSTEILGPYIAGHVVEGTAICPASVFLEMIIQAMQALWGSLEPDAVVIRDQKIIDSLIYSRSIPAKFVKVHASREHSHKEVTVSITSMDIAGSSETLHCTATVVTEAHTNLRDSWTRDESLIKRQRNYMMRTDRNNLNRFKTKVIYEVVFPRVVRYATEFRCLLDLQVSEVTSEATGSFKLPTTEGLAPFIYWSDTLFQAAGFAANISVPMDRVCICNKVDTLKILYSGIDLQGCFTLYCSLFDTDNGSIIVDTFAMDKGGRIVAEYRGQRFLKIKSSSFARILEMKQSGSSRESEKEIDTPETKKIHFGSSSCSRKSNSSDTTYSGQDIETTIAEIVTSTSGIEKETLRDSKTLSNLGIDSLMRIEMATKLQQAFPFSKVDHTMMSNCRTYLDIKNSVTTAVNGISKADLSLGNLHSRSTDDGGGPAFLQVSDIPRSPLILFHDGSGMIDYYRNLDDLGRNVMAFCNPLLFTNKSPFKNIQEMAGVYMNKLRQTGVKSAIFGGWSFGGVLAFEVANHWLEAGFDIQGLIIIDSPFPQNHEPLPETIIRDLVQDHNVETPIGSALLKEFTNNASLLGKYEIKPLATEIDAVILYSQVLVDTQSVYGTRYDWLSSSEKRSQDISKWMEMLGPHTRQMGVNGNHFDLFKAGHVEYNSSQLRNACDYLDNICSSSI